MTSSGNVSEHSTGSAVDISALNGIPIAGHQGPGTITETAVHRLLDLQGASEPHQIISLMQIDAHRTRFALPDHADHIHVGWRPLPGAARRPGRWRASATDPRPRPTQPEAVAQADRPARQNRQPRLRRTFPTFPAATLRANP